MFFLCYVCTYKDISMLKEMWECDFTCVRHACAGRVRALRHTAMDQTGFLLLCVVFPFKSRRLAHVESLGLVAISSASLGRLSSELGECRLWGSPTPLSAGQHFSISLYCTLYFIKYTSGPMTLTLVQFLSAELHLCSSCGHFFNMNDTWMTFRLHELLLLLLQTVFATAFMLFFSKTYMNEIVH